MIELVLIAGAVLLAAACIWGRPDPEDEFRRQCAAAGKDFRETQDAIYIRIAFVQLRRKASDLCVARNGDFGRQHIDEIAGLLAIGLGNHESAKSFLAWVQSCPTYEILYEDARALNLRYLTSKLTPIKPDPQIAADIKAAFRIQR
jgi:hypothetical protein